MRILVYQHFHPGHHLSFVGHLLPALGELGAEVVVALTEEGLASQEFEQFLAAHREWVRFDASLPPWRDRVTRNRRLQMHLDLRNEIRRCRPDYVLVPSGDQHTIMMGLFHLTGLGGLPGGRPGEVGIHWGRGHGATTPKERVKDVVDWLKLALAGWDQVHVANPLFYEQILARGGLLADRATLMPCPVSAGPSADRLDSRRALGLPIDGRLITIAGAIDHRKAVPEVLRAFRAAVLPPNDRILVAGAIHPAHRRTIERDFADLVRTDRVLLIDRFLTSAEYRLALASADVVCAPYPRFTAVSAVLLEGLAAGRPVLANEQGWCGEMVRRFQSGWSCDIEDPEALARTLRTAFEGCHAYQPTAATERLVAFHSPDNFGASWVRRLRTLLGLPPSAAWRSWADVGSAPVEVRGCGASEPTGRRTTGRP